jgi:hypothetical protein
VAEPHPANPGEKPNDADDDATRVESLAAGIECVRADEDFTARARRLLERDRERLERLAQ